ncbi:MAG: 7TM diverse intracellular signaling domain-containing protein [Leptospiraceae bacterium]|nr:7TM diverse intracellular signaling domain-containing protein [Leptospiraceae bacterium]
MIYLGGIVLLFLSYSIHALDTIRLIKPEGKIVIGIYTEYLEDKEGELGFQDILKKETGWVQSQQKNLNFGFATSAYWIRFQIENLQIQNQNWLLEISYPFLDRIDFYSQDKTGKYQVETTGDQFPFSNRKIPNRKFILTVPLSNESTKVYYLRIESKGGSNSFPAILYSPEELIDNENSETISIGIFYGVFFALLIYNSILFISIKDKSYFYYIFQLISSILLFCAINGLGQMYLWPNWVWFNNKAFPIFGNIAITSICLFLRNYLSTKINTPIAHKYLKFLIFLCLLNLILSLFIPYQYSIKIILCLLFYSSFLVIWILAKTIFKVRAARYLAIGWVFMVLGLLTFALKSIGILPENFFTHNSSQIGSIFEMISFSIGLGDKINMLREEKLQTQKKAIEEQKKLITSYARFVPEQLLTFLGKDIITKVSLGDSIQKEMTILFSDIRGFTTISEKLSPSENFGFINSYLEIMGPIIRKHNGFIDKYIGDGIMALFPISPVDSINASIEMLDELHNLNVKRKKKGFGLISIGIGIHTGSQMLGIIGEKERMEGTVISDVVNTASRLEGLTKIYSSALIVSEDVLKNIPDKSKYQNRYLDTVKVKGKDKAVKIFEILNGVSSRIIELKLQTKNLFEEAVQLYYSKQFDASLKIMSHVLEMDPKDKAAKLYIDRCNFYIRNGLNQEIDGIEYFDFNT